jgi:glutathione S-transferase
MTAREKDLMPMIEEVAVNPWGDDDIIAELHAVNPLGRVPALMGPSGEGYFDSRVICAFLDAQGQEPRLVPESGPDRFRVLRAEALADGILDSAVAHVLEGRRPEGQRSEQMQQRCRLAIGRGLSALREALPYLPRSISLGHIAFATVLGYLDFRLPQIEWRNGHEGLEGWYAEVSARPSFIETAPPPA